MDHAMTAKRQTGHRSRNPARACALAVVASIPVACTNVVIPPSAPEQPTAAFLLDHGRHASVVLESDEGLTRYAYGHWDYYARNRTGPLRASGTLFGRNPAGLGRKKLAGPGRLDAVRRQVRVPIQAAWRIDVPRGKAEELNRSLAGTFSEHAATRIANPLYDLEFVRHPVPYHVGHNSNHVAGQWLRALGCEVDMNGPYSSWRVEPAANGKAP